jgi:hypothetical protein
MSAIVSKAHTAVHFAAALFAASLVAGCATQNTPAFTSAAPPSPGRARLVVLRPNSFSAKLVGAPIKVDGELIGEPRPGNHVFRDIPPGNHELTAERWDQPGVSRHTLQAVGGRTYYFLLKENEDKLMAQTVGAVGFGLVGWAVATAATNDGKGFFQFIPISADQAQKAIAE